MSLFDDPLIAALAELDPKDLSLDEATPGLAHQLRRTRHGATTVAAWIAALPNPHRAGAHTRRWLSAEAARRGIRPTGAVLSATSTPAVVGGWLSAVGLGHLATHDLIDLPGVDAVLPRHAWWHASGITVSQAFGGNWNPLSAYREGIAATLNALAARVHTGAPRIDALRAARTSPPAEEGLRDLWSSLWDVFDGLDAERQLIPPDPHRTATVDRASILVHSGLGGRSVVVPFDAEHYSVEEACDRPKIAEAFIHLLDILATPDDPSRAAIAAAFGAPRWMRDLDALSAPQDAHDRDDKPVLLWRLTESGARIGIDAERGRLNKAGTRWVTRRSDVTAPPGCDPADAELLDLIQTSSQRTGVHLPRLIGHPRVLRPGRSGDTIPVRRAPLVLAFDAEGDTITLNLSIDGRTMPLHDTALRLLQSQAGAHAALLNHDALHVIPMSPDAARWLRQWLSTRPKIPRAALPELARRLPAWSAVAPVRLGPTLRGDEVPGDRRPVVTLEGDLAAVRVAVTVQPLHDAPAFVPGDGPSEVHGMRDDAPVFATRDLDAEPQEVLRQLDGVPLHDDARIAPWAWTVDGTVPVLQLVQALRERDGALRIGWAHQLPVVRRAATVKDLSLRIASGRDWFGLEGKVAVDGVDASLGDLLAADDETPGFVRLRDGSWAAITRELSEAVAAATAAGTDRRGAARVAPWNAGVVDALAAAGADVVAPPDFAARAARIREARTLDAPIPAGLQATLYPYQADGFRWLASLAHWSPGAILADDMGLGKTVQALALLLRRAADGPALVVVPTSLGFNWRDELSRFAPGLTAVWHHGTDRDPVEPKAGEVWVTTWGVLVRDLDALAAVRWHTLVLDEAHAIKNPETRRAKAVRRLDAAFRLALTGTPLENHLGELWSLFDAIVPGLLGTRQRFHERFRAPIEAGGDTRRRGVLARAIAPFLLRRTKAAVAPELPDRIEIVHRVARSPAERALYEAVRRRAADALADAGGPGGGRLQFLAALQTLRQLACHPALVDRGSPVASSKLSHVRRLVADLREQGHRVLLFSQFTRHLDLVQAALEADGARALRLDGSTAVGARERAVGRFQAGEADVFLISLKAGGVGLNLTAATYVIHLDPWWNPASEDQATDRAHRLGQTRAVTVIRVVAQGTIEEQILSLHADKRELAEQILDGTGDTARVDLDTLRTLLAEVSSDSDADDDDQPPNPT